MIPSSSSMDSRHRLSFSTEKTSRRRFQRIEKGVKFSTLRFVLVCIMLGALFTIYCFRYPPLQIAENPTSFGVTTDPRYVSSAEINWNHVSNVIEKYLFGRSKYQGIGIINLNENEIDRLKEVTKSDCDHVALNLDYAAKNITWESLYPEWIDEVEDFEVPTCPSLPLIHIPGKPRMDLVIAKLPCIKSGKWSRDVARLHLQLAAARVAASSKGLHDVHVILVSDCFPIPNLFTGEELVARQGNIWLYKPSLHQLRQKLQLPVGSCELSVPLQAKDNFYSASTKKEAYATILHSAQLYVCGAIAAAQSIRMSGSTRDLVLLVDESISEYHKSGLEAAGWKIHMFQRIRNPNAVPNAYNEWNYSKFRLWQLTQYSKIIFIDADMLILRNIDFLFEFPEISAIGNNATLFNSGLMVVEPSNSTFQLLMDNINDVVSYNGGDQGYLNEIFTWWHRIPKHMNFLKHFWEGDEPEIKKMKTNLFGADPPILYVLHYLGFYKPWLCFRDYDCNWNVDYFQEFASDVAHKTWWRVHDAMPENLHKFCLLRSKQKAQLEWDRRQAEKGNYKDGHWKIKIKDHRLKTCFEDFCFWESMLWHWGETNVTDNSSTIGIKLAGTIWDKEALTLAEKVCKSFNGDLGIYAFKTLPNSSIQVRIERLTSKSGSPTMEDIEAYSKSYRAKLAEAELAKSIPDNISLEVSSPGVERVVRIPQDLDRYMDRSMYVRYITEDGETEGDGIFRLVSFDVETKSCIWGIADIRVNREKAGKGRPLSKKQREWRLETAFESLRLVRLHSEC